MPPIHADLVEIISIALAEGIGDVNEGEPLTAANFEHIARKIIVALAEEGFDVPQA